MGFEGYHFSSSKSEDFVLLVMVAYWAAPNMPLDFDKPIQLIEYFAGVGRIAGLAHLMGYEARAVDIEYDHPSVGMSHHSGLPKRSSFDFCGEAGFVLLDIITLMAPRLS